MYVEVIKATADQEPILANLLELYIHDLSSIFDLYPDSNGRFGYKYLPLYWQENDRYPFLIKADGNLAGFVLIRKGSEILDDENVWDVAEFFIVRGYRKNQIGTRAAHEIWKKFSGFWEVRVNQKNKTAQAFWSEAINSFTGIKVNSSVKEIKGKSWNVFSFNTETGKVY